MNNISCVCKGIGYWGGFCLGNGNKYVGGNKGYDISLSYRLADLFKDKTVVDLSAGLGWYCPIISRKSKKCDQFDGSVNIEEVTKGKVKYLNLAEPIEFEKIFINNLLKCSKEGILISWSTTGQRGHFHVNNKKQSDVIKLFESNGVYYDNATTNIIRKGTTFSYVRRNLLFFNKNIIID